MSKAPQKTEYHKTFLKNSLLTRKALLAADKLVDARYTDEDGEPLSPADLRLKAGIAIGWLQKAETAIATARINLQKEIDHRENEADPVVIERRRIETEMKRLPKRKRRTEAEIRPQVLALAADGMGFMAIADTLHVSDFTVKRILRSERKTA